MPVVPLLKSCHITELALNTACPEDASTVPDVVHPVVLPDEKLPLVRDMAAEAAMLVNMNVVNNDFMGR